VRDARRSADGFVVLVWRSNALSDEAHIIEFTRIACCRPGRAASLEIPKSLGLSFSSRHFEGLWLLYYFESWPTLPSHDDQNVDDRHRKVLASPNCPWTFTDMTALSQPRTKSSSPSRFSRNEKLRRKLKLSGTKNLPKRKRYALPTCRESREWKCQQNLVTELYILFWLPYEPLSVLVDILLTKLLGRQSKTRGHLQACRDICQGISRWGMWANPSKTSREKGGKFLCPRSTKTSLCCPY